MPGDSQIRIVVAQSLIRVGRTQEAYEEVERIPEDQRDAAAYFALGRLDLAFGRLDLGRERLMKANELQPDNAAVLRALLALDRESGNVEASRQRIAAAAEANPDDSELLELKAEVALIQGDLESAETSLTRAVEVDPRNVSAQLSLAGVAQRLGDVERTIQVVEKASQALPESAELQFRLAVLYENHGDRQQAIGAYERAIALDDGLAQAKNNLAYLLAETPGGDLDRALELAQQAKEQLPDDPNAADTLGWVLLKRGVPSAAIGYLEEAAERFPAEAYEVQGIVQNHLAQAYEQNAEADKAMAASRNVLQSYEQLSAVARQRGIELPEPEWATEAKARIERLEAAS